MRKATAKETEKFKKIRGKKAMFHITKTILDKHIQDANRAICEALKESNIINYEHLGLGEKKIFKGRFKGQRSQDVNISCYRANGRGDKRIWFKGIAEISKPDDMMALSVHADKITIHNLTGE